MAGMPLLKPMEVARILDRFGFKLIRQDGSHMFFKHPDGRATVVPNHPGEEIRKGLLNKIIKEDLKMGRDDFLRML